MTDCACETTETGRRCVSAGSARPRFICAPLIYKLKPQRRTQDEELQGAHTYGVLPKVEMFQFVRGTLCLTR